MAVTCQANMCLDLVGATTRVDYQFAWQTSMLVSQIEKCVKSAPSMRCGRNGNMNLRFHSAQPLLH